MKQTPTEEQKMGTINRPVPFPGTRAEADANHATHRWIDYGDGEAECLNCACKPWHTHADYPCGTKVPREVVTWGAD